MDSHHGLVVLDPVQAAAAINRVSAASAIQAVVVRVPCDGVIETGALNPVNIFENVDVAPAVFC